MEVQSYTYSLDCQTINFWTSGNQTWSPESINFENRKVVLLHSYGNGLDDPVFQIFNNSEVKDSFYTSDGTFVLFFLFDMNVNNYQIIRIVKWFIEEDHFEFRQKNNKSLNKRLDSLKKIPFNIIELQDLNLHEMIKLNTTLLRIHNMTPQEYVGIDEDSDDLDDYLDSI